MFTKKLCCNVCENEISKSKGNEGIQVNVVSYTLWTKKKYMIKVCDECTNKFLNDVDYFIQQIKDHEAFEGRQANHYTMVIKKEY